jgi:hypothetical protein
MQACLISLDIVAGAWKGEAMLESVGKWTISAYK